MMDRLILILEDDEHRARRFLAAISAIGWRARVWQNAHVMMEELPDVVAGAAVISLDHDLIDHRSDPGDGLMVAKLLVSMDVRRPVVVHSSNADRALMMMGEFELAGWESRRVLPFGEDWIESEWVGVVRELAP